MNADEFPRDGRAAWSTSLRRWLLVATLTCWWSAHPAPVRAQPGERSAPPTVLPISELPPLAGADGFSADGLTQVRLAPPRPAEGPGSVGSFVESLRGNDATFEVIVGQGRILTLKEDISQGPNQPLIAAGDPSIIEYTLVNPRQVRILGQRIGVTDLSITTANNETYNFEVRVQADLVLLEGKLRETFPDASLKLGQMRDHVIVEGEARDGEQISKIIQMIQAYLRSVAIGEARKIQGGGITNGLPPAGGGGLPPMGEPEVAGPILEGPGMVEPGMVGPIMEGPGIVPMLPPGVAAPEIGAALQIEGEIAPPQIINLIRVPGSQQVMLKVRVAELNRTALRRIGSNFLGVDPESGAIVGSQIAGVVGASGTIAQIGQGFNDVLFAPGGRQLLGTATEAVGGTRPFSASFRMPTSCLPSTHCGAMGS